MSLGIDQDTSRKVSFKGSVDRELAAREGSAEILVVSHAARREDFLSDPPSIKASARAQATNANSDACALRVHKLQPLAIGTSLMTVRERSLTVVSPVRDCSSRGIWGKSQTIL